MYTAGEQNLDTLIPKLSSASFADAVNVLVMCVYPWV